MPDKPPPPLEAFISSDELDALIRRARDEDLGPDGLDVTSELFVPANLLGEAAVIAREPGWLAGAALLKRVAGIYDKRLDVSIQTTDGSAIRPGQSVATLSGPMRSILSAERVAMNLITHLSGIASLTARYVEQTAGTQAQVYDTRKTLPGLRALEKYAVACGGGATHRMGLYDAVLLKDNHLAHIQPGGLTQAIADAVKRSREAYPDLTFVMVEVDTLDQLKDVLPTGVDIVLLDNMDTEQLKQAVALRDGTAPKVELEASGGVTLETIRAIAESGVDRISVGALTHSAPALDLGLDIQR